MPSDTGKQPGEQTPPVSQKQATLTEEADRLLTLAEDSDTVTAQQSYRLKAIYLLIKANDLTRARTQLDILKGKKSLTASDEANIQLVSALIAIAEKNASLANTIITTIKPVTREQQIKFYELKADYDFLTRNYMFAIDRRIQLDTYITDEAGKLENNKKIWAALSNMSTVQLNNQQPGNATIRGWIELAKVMRTGQQNISQLENKLLDWGTRNPTHPLIAQGDNFLHTLIDDYQLNKTSGKHIAVLLPMQGEMSTATATIKNGLLSAYYRDSKSTIKPEITFYDTSDKNVNFNDLYHRAIDDGATNIIGPLDKVILNQLAQQSELDIPVLGLNYAENTLNQTVNLFQFGLAPEDEARQVAELAIVQGRRFAAVFYPDSEWGKRLQEAFSNHFAELGGTIITRQDYTTNTNDYTRPIRQLLNLDESDIRTSKVENTISKKTQSTPYRRHDIDMIFLAATHRSARGIMPAFKFHHAADLPVYSTSHVYTGKVNRELDRDLNGIIFCDMPWILQNTSPLATTFTKNWPQQENYTRLFAFGVDAYYLIYNLDYLANTDYASYDGQTGNLQLDDHNRITRKLLWAKFINGIPVYFEPTINLTVSNTETQDSDSPTDTVR